jgi:hypothetical protein
VFESKKPSSSATFVDPVRYKTMICGNFSATGICPYGELCVYAHGEQELRDMSRNSAAVRSLRKLASQVTKKLGHVPFSSFGPLRYRKRPKKSAGNQFAFGKPLAKSMSEHTLSSMRDGQRYIATHDTQ